VTATKRGRPSALAALVLLATVATGCTSARSTLGSSGDTCYTALPTAFQAVGPDSRMAGVRGFTLGQLRLVAPHLYQAISPGRSPAQQVCVVAFIGTFTRATVSRPLGRPSGGLAVVVSANPTQELLGTVIFKRAPLDFGRFHAG